jgi:SAM-dependent methyltransferase
MNLYIGYRLDLFKALAESGPTTVENFAKVTKNSERYLREWLEGMTAGGYLDYDAGSSQFSLSPEHATCLIDQDSAAYALPFVAFVPSFAGVLPQLMEAFRTGGGVPYEAYGDDCLEAIGMGNRPMFVNDYVDKWIPAMPDIENRLKSGARVIDVGCGVGWGCISLAKGFPETKVDGIDCDEASIDEARRNANKSGLSDRVTFHTGMVEDSTLQGPYDLVTAFEVVHDMPYPVKGLQRMHELVARDGVVLLAEEAVGDTLEENMNFTGHFNYNFSVLHCLPQGLVFPEAAGIGTVMGPATVRKYAREAGFSKVDILPIENPMKRFYRLTP